MCVQARRRPTRARNRTAPGTSGSCRDGPVYPCLCCGCVADLERSGGEPMRAVIYTGAGGPEVIAIGEVPKPEVRPGHIRVRVHAAGLNRADLIQRRGQYAAPNGWPADIPGLEYAGEVEAVRGASKWKVGDRVMGLVGGGAMAELLTVHQDEVLAIPEGMPYPEAAAVPEVFLTAY